MADTMSLTQRHHCMSSIRSKNTKPEMLVRRYLHSNGFRYAHHTKRLPGKPDIVLRKYHSVVFVHGCFWHGHPGCPDFRPSKSNDAFWKEKVRANKERDSAEIGTLEAMGWNVIVVWECELKKDRVQGTMEELTKTLRRQMEAEMIHHIPLSVRKQAHQDPTID